MTATRHGESGELRPLTWDDLQQLDDEGLRYEIVDGVLLVSPAPYEAAEPFTVKIVPSALLA